VGQRISDLRLKRSGQLIETSRDYAVLGRTSNNQAVAGPPIWDLVCLHLTRRPINNMRSDDVELRGAIQKYRSRFLNSCIDDGPVKLQRMVAMNCGNTFFFFVQSDRIIPVNLAWVYLLT